MDPRNDAVFRDDDLEDDEESLDDDDEELEEEEELNSASSPPSVTVITVPAPSITSISSSDLIRQRLDSTAAVTTTTTTEKKEKPSDFESRKLFQRLWTDEDEIELLQGFLDYTTHRGGGGGKGTNHHHHHHQNDTALFYDQIKSKLQLDFNKNQLVEKLRRLKKKFRTVVGKINSGKDFNFKSPHDLATFEISRKIWSNNSPGTRIDDTATTINNNNNLDVDDEQPVPNSYVNYIDPRNDELLGNCGEKKAVVIGTVTPKSRKRPRAGLGVGVGVGVRVGNENLSKEKVSMGGNNENHNVGGNVAGLIEETVRSCMSPLFKELLSCSSSMGGGLGGGGGLCGGRGFSGLALHPIPLSFGGASMNFGNGGEIADERWRKQQILELEVYSKRLELVQEQIKTALEELKSIGG